VTATTSPDQRFRPRYGRIAAFTAAVLSTLVTVSAGVGLLPTGGAPAQAAQDPGGAISLAGDRRAVTTPSTDGSSTEQSGPGGTERAAATGAELAVPSETGEGRRVVFDMSRQRVWLVDADEEVRRSYLVSGSELDNLKAGTYEVFSRSRHAQGIDGSTMEYMVRFTTGENAAIGFHDIPLMDGEPVQTKAELGTPLSHGCVRQAKRDAVALWRFAPVGTTVVVTT
jgi:hypothetical protein